MHSETRVSVIINNHDYGAFLPHCIDSALAQTHAAIEVIVVDDGSEDRSREILAAYGPRIVAICKPNGGQASAFNAGWSVSRGEILCLLDADDWWMPEKVARIAKMVSTLGVQRPLMLCHRMRRFEAGRPGEPMPERFWGLAGDTRSGGLVELSSPDEAWAFARERRDLPFIGSPTSALSLTRTLAEKVFPVPEVHEAGADALLARGCAITGELFATDEVLGFRRFHGANRSVPEQRHLRDRAFLDAMCAYLNRLLVARGREPVLAF